MEKTTIVDTIRKRLKEISEKHRVIIPVNFDPEILSELIEEREDFQIFDDDLKNPFQHLKTLENKAPQDLFTYLLQIAQPDTKPLLITQWFYTFIHQNFRNLADTLDDIAFLYNDGKSFTKKEEETLINYDHKYNIENLDNNAFVPYSLFSDIPYTSCSSSEKLYDLLDSNKIYSLNTSAKLKERLSDAGFSFVNKVEQSTVQLFNKLGNEIKTRIRELSALDENGFRLNPVYFDGYIPNSEVQKIPLENNLNDVFNHSQFRQYKKHNKEGKNKEIIGQDELIRFLLEQNLTENNTIRDLLFGGES
ncbi:MAG: hypothetical protein ACLFQE_08395 [Thermotogota bacterium]